MVRGRHSLPLCSACVCVMPEHVCRVGVRNRWQGGGWLLLVYTVPWTSKQLERCRDLCTGAGCGSCVAMPSGELCLFRSNTDTRKFEGTLCTLGLPLLAAAACRLIDGWTMMMRLLFSVFLMACVLTLCHARTKQHCCWMGEGGCRCSLLARFVCLGAQRGQCFERCLVGPG